VLAASARYRQNQPWLAIGALVSPEMVVCHYRLSASLIREVRRLF